MSKGGTPAMWPKPGIVPGSTSLSVHHSAGISADTSSTVPSASDAYERAHDPICSVKYREAIAADDCWRCRLVARAREDERAAALRDAVAAVEAQWTEDPSWDGTNWNNALDCAMEAIKALGDAKNPIAAHYRENPHEDANLTGAVNISQVDTPSQQQIDHMNLAEIWDEDLIRNLS